MKVAVNLDNDTSDGFSVHGYSLPTQLLPYALVPAVEEIVPHNWPQGGGKHAFTSTVFHHGRPIAQEGHDAGSFIADRAMALNAWANGRRFLLEMGSCRRFAFAASTVNMNGKATGAASDDVPLMTCGEPCAVPWAWPTMGTWNTVHVGLTAEDVTMGWVAIGLSIFADCAFYVLGMVLSTTGAPGAGLLDVLEGGGFDWKKSLVAMRDGAVLGLYRSYASGWTKPVTVKLEGGFLGGSVSMDVTYDPKEHQWKHGRGIAFGSKKASAEVVYDTDDGSLDVNTDQNIVSSEDVSKAASDPSLLTT